MVSTLLASFGRHHSVASFSSQGCRIYRSRRDSRHQSSRSVTPYQRRDRRTESDDEDPGFRPQDLDTAHLPFLQGLGCGVGFSDPVFCAKNGFSHVKGETVLEKTKDAKEILMASLKWLGEGAPLVSSLPSSAEPRASSVNSGYFHTFEQLAFLRENWEGQSLPHSSFRAER